MQPHYFEVTSLYQKRDFQLKQKTKDSYDLRFVDLELCAFAIFFINCVTKVLGYIPFLQVDHSILAQLNF